MSREVGRGARIRLLTLLSAHAAMAARGAMAGRAAMRGRAAMAARALTMAMAAVVATTLSACVSTTDRAPVQYLDRDTAVTFTVVATPLTFAHVRPEVAARVRDYATVAAASVDRNGRVQYVLLIYLWSTVDPRNAPGITGSPPDLVLAADDRRIPLHPISDPRQPLPPIDRPPTRHCVAAMYATDLPTLRFLTAVRYLSLLRGEGSQEARFGLWRDERQPLAALTAFVHSSE